MVPNGCLCDQRIHRCRFFLIWDNFPFFQIVFQMEKILMPLKKKMVTFECTADTVQLNMTSKLLLKIAPKENNKENHD